MDIIERDIYALIVSGDGIKAREIAKKLNKDRSTVNHYLYNSPYMKDLCYRDENYEWYGLIRQSRPHVGLGDYSGYYGTVAEFLELTEDEWFQMLTEGCRKIGRNLNDTRGLFHSFRDSYEVMKNLFADLSDADVKFDDWEILFELRIKKSRYIRIYADVLVITENYVFSLEFVIVKGMAGTAKTFYSLAVGLEKILNNPTGEYRRILICRPNAQFDSDIGFLPGGEMSRRRYLR